MAASRPSSPAGSKVSITDSGKSGSSQRSKKPKQEEEEIEELDPLCLPNTSPNDVVSDWLRGIPADSSMDNPEDEMNEGIEETEEKGEEGEEKGGETEGQGGEETEEKQEPVETTEMEQENTAETGQQEQEVKKAAQQPEEEGEVKEEEEEREEEEEKEVKEEEEREEGECSECADCCPDPAPPTNDITSPCHPHLFLSSESELPRSCHSSVAVMKVLLSPSLGRCSSLPEIGSVYGRRLSSSAKGLLDCLAQLQLIDPPTSPAADPSPDRGQSYQEVMDILQSLWLSEPEKGKEDEGEEKERLKDSGVDLTSVSAGSGGSGKTRPDETAGDITLIEAASPAATPDITSRVRGSPGDDEGRGELLQTPESLQIPGSPSSSDSTAYKSPTDTERDTPEDTPSSGTPPSVQRALLTKRVSQDPDPVWVLNLLKKLEKQFMTHYVDAMAEFKVRWDLDDNAMLDAMITELRDEVKKRIQTSIDHELRKIRGRASRGPRPPNLSRESAETDQRRRRLKVMKVQSVNESDGEQGSGDVSDQRSEDEYCPCDACIRKKAEAQAIKMEAVVAKAPVMMAFDLCKILRMKKDPEPPAPPTPKEGKNNDNLEEEEKKEEEEEEQVGDLEVVHEDEEDKEEEDIIPTVVIQEAIPEEEEEEERVTGGEEEEEGQESDGAESLIGEVEEKIAEEIEAEEQEEDGG
ncbi:retinitis pigmentosa 1-like 1 protein [Coregonus clupeaformis]|uniref:retinitis pigmentosa 1-like 1 protein n=1 Tax=Coregonus clupeaformis TaxID=59861 RepID=UPI001E1C2DFF|nr:retinitis pigmentosa 1-like 1 protein [Coregonus clupeaformis]